MEKPKKKEIPNNSYKDAFGVPADYQEDFGYNKACDDWQVYHDQEMARKVELDEDEIEAIIEPVLSEDEWIKICVMRKQRNLPILSRSKIIAQAICSRSGEMRKVELDENKTYLAIANDTRIMDTMMKYQNGDASRRFMCLEIAQAICSRAGEIMK